MPTYTLNELEMGLHLEPAPVVTLIISGSAPTLIISGSTAALIISGWFRGKVQNFITHSTILYSAPAEHQFITIQ